MKILTKLALTFVCFAFGQSAFATKASLNSMGEGQRGTLLFSDSRNYLLNPAAVFKTADLIQLEAGSAKSSSSQTKGEGGMVTTIGDSKVALHLGSYSSGVDWMNEVESSGYLTTTSFYSPENSLELVFAKEFGASVWGASLHYASSKSDTKDTAMYPDDEAQFVSIRTGFENDSSSAYLNLDITGKSKTESSSSAAVEYKQNPSADFGYLYELNEKQKVLFNMAQAQASYTNDAGGNADIKKTSLSVNFMQKFVEQEANLVFVTVGLLQNEMVVDYETTGTDSPKNKSFWLPVRFAVRSQFNSFCLLQASVSQNTLIDQNEYRTGGNNVKTENSNGTTLSAGTSMNFNSWTVDANIAAFNQSGGTVGQLNGNSLLSSVAVVYKF